MKFFSNYFFAFLLIELQQATLFVEMKIFINATDMFVIEITFTFLCP